MPQNIVQRKVVFFLDFNIEITVIAREEIHWIWQLFFWVGPGVVYEWCPLSTCAENIQWFNAKAVLTNFLIGAKSQEGMLLAFAFKFQMVVRLQGLHSVNKMRQDDVSKMV